MYCPIRFGRFPLPAFVFCRFGATRVLFHLPPCVSQFQPERRSEHCVFRFGGHAKVGAPSGPCTSPVPFEVVAERIIHV